MHDIAQHLHVLQSDMDIMLVLVVLVLLLVLVIVIVLHGPVSNKSKVWKNEGSVASKVM